MDLLGDARIVITRRQYDEALAQLPDAATFEGSFVEVLVSSGDLFQKTGVSEVPGTEHWPMPVWFEKVVPQESRYTQLGLLGPCWRLDPRYQFV